MRDIHRTGLSENWNQQQYKVALRSFIAKNRVELRAGNIALNKHARPWAKAKENSVEVKI